MVVLCGLGGAGKTSVAVEYAHERLDEVGLAWQFAAENPAVLAAEFSELAAQLGLQDVGGTQDPVAGVHNVLTGFSAGWLLVFDNAPDLASVERFLPPAGPGRIPITSQTRTGRTASPWRCRSWEPMSRQSSSLPVPATRTSARPDCWNPHHREPPPLPPPTMGDHQPEQRPATYAQDC
jgi:hypothetical protein